MSPDDVTTARPELAAARAKPFPLTLALADYDRTRPLLDGRVKPEGIVLSTDSPSIGDFCKLPIYERFDVAEMSLSMYVAARCRGDKVIALPIFPLRMAVLGYIFCRRDAPYRQPKDLIGKRIATIGYRYTVNLWLRGILKDHYGVAPEQFHWVTGEHETTGYVIPPGIPYTVVTGKTPGELLLAGEVEAVMGPEPPEEFLQGDPRIRRLFADAQREGAEYFRRTGIYPITHTVVMSEASWRAKQWVCAPLLAAFRAAQVECDRFYGNAKHVSFPDAIFFMEEQRRVWGAEPYQHGLASNRHILETFIRYAHEQGYIERRPAVEELFAENTLSL